MLFQLEHGKTAAQAVKDAFAWGVPPKQLKQLLSALVAPKLHFGLELFFEAFWRLSSCRQVGMGQGPIPWTAIQEYARIQELSAELADDLEFHVMAMDSAYLEWSSKKKPGE